MDFDTGSSDLWVFNTQLSAADTKGHNVYDPTKSPTKTEVNGATFSITYGDNSFAQGNVVKDNVNIGGVTVTQQAVELATKVASSFVTDTASDGLLGLAFSTINTVQPQQQKTFFDNALSTLDQPVFTANLRHGQGGSYEFGEIDATLHTGQITNVPVDSSNGFWQITSTAFSVGNDTTNLQQNANASPAIADTGTSLMLVDDAVATAYYKQVQGAQLNQEQGGFTFPCNTALPNFNVQMGDTYVATIPGALINFSPVSQAPGDSAAAQCFGGIQSNGGSNLQVYGDVMFKSQFVVFDGSKPQLGFAPQANPVLNKRYWDA